MPGVTPDSFSRGRFDGRRGRDRVEATVMTLKVEMRMKHQPVCCGLEQSQDFPRAAQGLFRAVELDPASQGLLLKVPVSLVCWARALLCGGCSGVRLDEITASLM